MPRAAGIQLRHRLARTVRGLVIAAIVTYACYLAYGFGKLWAERQRAAQPREARLAAATSLDSPAIMLPLAGHWSFAELDWSLRSENSSTSDVAERFATLAAQPAPNNVDSLPDVSPELVRLVEGLKIGPTERNGNRIYRLEQPQLKAQLIIRPAGGQLKAVSLAVAYRQDSDSWRLLDFTPQRSAGGAASNNACLLPVPIGSKRCGGRFTDDGQALLELVAVDSTAKGLFALWNDAGWECRHSGLAGAAQFSYLCVRGKEVIYAWSADPPTAIRNLMLVRTPAPGDTTP